jgi:hypothetical protein
MPDLEMLLREARPAPDPAWAARLDARVAARFPGPPPRWKTMLESIRVHFMALSAVGAVGALIVALVIAAPSFNGGDDSDSGNTAAMKAPAPTPETAQEESGGGSIRSGSSASERQKSDSSEGLSGGGSDAAVPAPLSAAPPASSNGVPRAKPRSVIAAASITLSTTPDDVASVTDRAIRVIDGLGGFVQSSDVSQNGSSASSTLTAKIPSGKLETGLAQLSRLAHVKARTQQTEDVTDQKAALEAAVRDARADQAGLRVRLAKATTDKDRAHLRALLDRASRRVTRAERRVASLGQDVSYSTVELEIRGDRKPGAVPAAPPGRWTPGDALHDAGRVLEVIAGVLLIALAILVPLGLLVALGVLAGRVLTHRRRERALDIA